MVHIHISHICTQAKLRSSLRSNNPLSLSLTLKISTKSIAKTVHHLLHHPLPFIKRKLYFKNSYTVSLYILSVFIFRNWLCSSFLYFFYVLFSEIFPESPTANSIPHIPPNWPIKTCSDSYLHPTVCNSLQVPGKRWTRMLENTMTDETQSLKINV